MFNAFRISKLMVLLASLAAVMAMSSCLSNNEGGTEVPNGVKGRIVDTQGKGISGVTVALYPANYVPSLASAKVAVASVVTDGNGNYVLPVSDSGLFNIEGHKGSEGVFIDSVHVVDSGTTVPRDTLKALGVIRGISHMPGQNDTNQVRLTLYMPGTRRITKPAIGGAFTFDEVPEGNYQIILDPTLNSYNVRVMNVQLRAGDTLDLDTVRLDVYRPDTISITTSSVSGVWGPGNTYLIKTHVGVPAGATLTILPGTRVIFMGEYNFGATGTLICKGTQDSMVLFSYGFEKGMWGTVNLFRGSESRLSRVIFEKSSGGIFSQDSTAIVSHSVFRYNKIGAVGRIFHNNIFHDNTETSNGAFTPRPNAKFMNNIVIRNYSGISFCRNSNYLPAIVNGNLFYENGEDFRVMDGCGAAQTNLGLTDSGSVTADPQFVSLVKGQEDYHLKLGSPAIGAGINGTDMGIYSTYVPEE